MPTVTVHPSGHTFPCEGKQTILEAALSASVSFDYGCTMGTCGLCQARLLKGKIEKVRHYDFALKEADKLNGAFLLCSYAAATSSITIEASVASSGDDIPLQAIDARIKKFNVRNDVIGIAMVQTPRTSRLRFLAGQNARFTLPAGATADLPIASCPCDDRNIEIHVRRHPSEEFSTALFEATEFPLPVHLEGPWGPGFGRNERGVTVCFAYDTYIAPIRSWIELQLTDEAQDQVILYWYAPTPEDFYLDNLLASWSDAFDAFHYSLIAVSSTEELSAGLPLPHADPVADRVLAAGPPWFTDVVERKSDANGSSAPAVLVHSPSGFPAPDKR